MNLPSSNVLLYEELVKSNGSILSRISAKGDYPDVDLENRNFSPEYERQTILHLADILLQSKGSYWNFYSKTDVEELLNQYLLEQ